MATAESKQHTRSTAEERREQLLRVARGIIETEGVEALRPTRVAEVAGCTRPLIYQYFPRREDIFIAITEELYDVLEQTSDAHGATVIPDAAEGNVDPARALVEALWRHLDERGPAALILRSTPEVSADFRAYLDSLRNSHETRWRKGFLDLGLDETQADFALSVLFTADKVIAMQYLEGRLDRETAVRRVLETIGAVLQGLLGGTPTTTPPPE